MDSSFTSSLKSVLKEAYVNAQRSYNTPYALYNESAVEYLYKLSQPIKPTMIFLKLLGKNNQTILKNDSIADYYSMFKNFSIQYKRTGLFDIYGETKGNSLFSYTLQPIELLFIIRANNLYLLMMSAYIQDEDTKYSPRMLYNLIMHNK
jgi:hypothetical protein